MRAIESEFMARLSEIDAGFAESQRRETQSSTTVDSTDVVDQTAERTVRVEETTDVPVVPDDRPEEMRKLWKSIAVATHPDKTGGDADMTETYKRASRAWEDKKYEELISIAMDLGIQTEETDDSSVVLLSMRSDQIQDRISKIESSVLWQWRQAPQDRKDAIIKIYLASKGRRSKE